MNPAAKYFRELTQRVGTAWNEFWFRPVDPFGVCVLRLLTGLMGLFYLMSFFPDLVTWFGADGLLPVATVSQLTSEADQTWNARASYLYWIDDPTLLWAVHAVGMAILAAFAAGFATRITSVLSLVVVLSYVHRAPMVTGQFEPVLTLMLFYLCFAPCGRKLSIDSWISQRRRPDAHRSQEADEPSVAAAVCSRLMQLHIAALYVMMGLTKLGGSDAWWVGEAVWWLIAQTESRLVDLTFLHSWGDLINLWTLGIVAFEIIFGLLVWKRLARPLLLGIAAVHWVLIALITGLVSYAGMMLVANLAFVSPGALRAVLGIPRQESK